MLKRYTNRELIALAKEYGWREVSKRGDHITALFRSINLRPDRFSETCQVSTVFNANE
jgi:hypothetical protein